MMRWETYKFDLNSARGRLHILWAVILFGFLLFPFLFDSGSTGLLSCKFHQITGLSCPTCGMSRSLHELSQFHLPEAFKMHLFGPVIYILALTLFFKLSIELVSGSAISIGMSSRILKKVIVVFGLLWVLYWLVRLTVEIIHA